MHSYKQVRIPSANGLVASNNHYHRLLIYTKRTRNMRDTLFFLFREYGIMSVHTDSHGRPIPVHDECYLPSGKYAADNPDGYSLQCWEVYIPGAYMETINNEYSDCLDLHVDRKKPIVRIEYVKTGNVPQGMGKSSPLKHGNFRKANPVVHATGIVGTKDRDIMVAPHGRITMKLRPKNKRKPRSHFRYVVIERMDCGDGMECVQKLHIEH